VPVAVSKRCVRPMPVTWLHISDIHLKADGAYDRNVVLTALIKSVRGFREREKRKPDIIFATGDIAHAGQSGEYKVATEFFDQLLEAAKLDRSHLYVVPGNHDVDRRLGAGLARTLLSRSAADDYFDPLVPKPHLTQKLGGFLRWYQDYFAGIRNMPVNSTCGPLQLVRVQGYKLVIFPINTALFCQDDNDHEKLFVGRRCLSDALEEIKSLDASLKVALMHHPLEFLSGIERQHIRAGLIDYLDVVLTGHLHEEGIARVQMGDGRNLYCAAGATYQGRDWPNKALYATFEGDHVRIFPICYFDAPREIWTLDTSQFPNEPGYEMRYPVPRGPDFRSFRLPGWSGLYHVPSPKLGNPTASATVNLPGSKSARGGTVSRGKGKDRPSKQKQKSAGKTKHNNKAEGKRIS